MKVNEICAGITALFPQKYQAALQKALARHEDIYEIRVRKQQPLVLLSANNTYFISAAGELVFSPMNAAVIAPEEIESIFAKLCRYSVYSFKESLNEGYVTLPGGARVGIAASAVVKNGEISAVKEIAALNFRIVRAVKTAAGEVLEALKNAHFPSAIIIGAPCSGKTTLLREACRLLSSGYSGMYQKCTVVDERGELAAMHGGIAGFELGANTDVLSFFPKPVGILNAVRTLSPDWIIADEIGSLQECRSVLQGLNSGVRFLISMHAGSIAQAKRKAQFRLLCESGDFGAVICLGSGNNLGKVEEIEPI